MSGPAVVDGSGRRLTVGVDVAEGGQVIAVNEDDGYWSVQVAWPEGIDTYWAERAHPGGPLVCNDIERRDDV